MPRGYWIGHVDVHDPDAYQRYREANAVPFARHGARFLVRGGVQEVREGTARPRTVVIEFPTIEAARACYDDPDYQAAKAIRAPASDADILIVAGCEEA